MEKVRERKEMGSAEKSSLESHYPNGHTVMVKEAVARWSPGQCLNLCICTVISNGPPCEVSITQSILLVGVPQTERIMLLLAIKKHLGGIRAAASGRRYFIPLLVYSSLFQPSFRSKVSIDQSKMHRVKSENQVNCLIMIFGQKKYLDHILSNF